ncbi:MAG: AI-2E family transporter [Bacteroidota bacterium]
MNKTDIQSNPALTFAAYLIIISVAMYASSIITPILLALFISIILAQPIKWLEKKKIPNGWAVTMVLTGSFLLFFGMGEIIAQSVAQFTQDAPQYADKLSNLSTSIFNTLHGFGFDLSIDNIENTVNPGKVMGYGALFLGEIGSLMGNLFLIVFVLIFVLLEINSFSVKMNAIIDTSDGAVSYFSRIADSIRQYLGLMTIISLLTGILVWLALVIIGVKYAILWAFLAFLLNFIPNIGSIVAGVPAILFAAVQLGFGGAMWTLGTYLAINMVVGNVIQPSIMGKGLGLSTLIVFISLIFWGFIFGTVGMFLSVPLTMIVKIILEQKESTKWIAIMLGTVDEAQSIVDGNKSRLGTS